LRESFALRALRSRRRPSRRPQAAAPASAALPTTVQPGPGADHPTWLAIQKKLRKIIGDGPHGAWFAQVGFAGIVDGVLALTAPHGLAAQKIEREYLPALRRAAGAAEVNVDRVLITNRRDYSGNAR
jgi:hypothetical protein